MYHMWSPVQPQCATQGQGADLQGQVILPAVCYGYLMVATDAAGEVERRGPIRVQPGNDTQGISLIPSKWTILISPLITTNKILNLWTLYIQTHSYDEKNV